MLSITRHGVQRCSQRAIRGDAIRATLDWGRPYRTSRGRVVWFLGRREVRAAARAGADVDLFVHTALVVENDDLVVTAVRTRSTRRFRVRWSRQTSRRRRSR